jgi:cephalosporin hydroxylase
MDDKAFEAKVDAILAANRDNGFLDAAKRWHDESRSFSYQYLFDWGGRPIIQDPQDVLSLQSLLWSRNPSLVVETGVARGGSLMLSASILLARAAFDRTPASERLVVGIDIALNEDTEQYIRNSGFDGLVRTFAASSTDPAIVAAVAQIARRHARKAFLFDSDHTHEHVLRELECYAPLADVGDCLLVLDTGIEFVPDDQQNHPRWRRGSNPYTAVQQFLARPENAGRFVVDDSHYLRTGITCARGGFLRRIA